MVRCIGTRSSQIALGAKPMIKNVTGLNPEQIARLELKNKMIPLIIHRIIPNAKDETWLASELDILSDEDD